MGIGRCKSHKGVTFPEFVIEIGITIHGLANVVLAYLFQCKCGTKIPC